MNWLPQAEVPGKTEGFEPKAGGDSCGLHELLEAFRELAVAGNGAESRGADAARLQPHDGIVAGSAGPPVGRW